MTEPPMRVGLIGLGAINLAVCRQVRARPADRVCLVGALVRDPARERPAYVPPLVADLEQLLDQHPEVIVEGSGHDALRQYGPRILQAGCDLLTLSVGALAHADFEVELRAAALQGKATLRIPAGAIGALDAIGAASLAELTSVTHITTKPARTLLPAGEAEGLREAQEVYRGPARAAAIAFPESLNVMAAVSLAGIGFDRTQVVVVADPAATRNQHVVTAEGSFGTLRFELRNVPSDENPRTGRLTGLSMYRALLDRRATLRIG